MTNSDHINQRLERMANYDILTFEAKIVRPIVHEKNNFSPPTFHFPGFQGQGRRIGAKMQRLEEPYQMISADIRQSELGLDPDYVLVFEVAGGVASIEHTINQIEGFHFLADEDGGAWEGEDDFYLMDGDKRLIMPQRLYAVLSNQRSVQHLMAMWNRYLAGETFKRGETAIFRLFEQLHDVHYWGIEDRVNETRIIENLQERLNNGEETVPLEIELWYFDNEDKANQAEQRIRGFIKENGGEVVNKCRCKEIKYHALAVQVPTEVALQIISKEDCEILSERSVRLFKPLGQTICAYDADVETSVVPNVELPPLTYTKPICALLDGLPVANHVYLRGRLQIDDPDNFADAYLVANREHGTGMASLIIHGDLNAHGESINRPLYVRPIMKPNKNNGESVPEGVLFPDILHQAIARIRQNPDLDDICIVNLSVCDASKPFMRAMSAEARMIDWLSEKYNILFIVSAGNHADDLEFEGTHSSLISKSPLERDKTIYAHLMSHARELRILAPAETINNLTIGSIHGDVAQQSNTACYDLLSSGLPATYSSIGFGANRGIKPDAIIDGGRMLYRSMGTDARYMHVAKQHYGPGQLVAYPQANDRIVHTVGTSNSAALATHLCHEIYEILRTIPNSQLGRDDMAMAIKTMFVHSCSWGELSGRLEQVLPPHPHKKRYDKAKLIGYGVPNIENVKWCTDDRVVVIGHGTLLQDNECIFEFPLPPSLAAKSIRKRLTITLGWNTPIAFTTDSRKVKMYFAPTNEKYIGSRSDSDKNMSRHGTIQHEAFEGDSAANFEDGSSIKITIGRKRDVITTPVKYMLMVTLEVAEASGLPIYEEVKARLNVNVPVNV